MTPLDEYYDRLPADFQECFLAARDVLLGLEDLNLEATYKWHLPFFYRDKRGVCYLNYRRKRHDGYLAFAAGRHLVHPLLVNEGQKTTRMLMLDPRADLPLDAIIDCTRQAAHWVEHNQKSWGY